MIELIFNSYGMIFKIVFIYYIVLFVSIVISISIEKKSAVFTLFSAYTINTYIIWIYVMKNSNKNKNWDFPKFSFGRTFS